jgi:hypothetical protein
VSSKSGYDGYSIITVGAEVTNFKGVRQTAFEISHENLIQSFLFTVKSHIDQTLRDRIDEAYSHVRLRRNRVSLDGEALTKILADLEASGDAMRHLDCKGQIAWKATPHLRGLLADRQTEAEADAEEEAM